MIRRQNLPEQVLEKKLSEPAAQLRRSENFVERSDIFTDFVNFSVRFFKAAQTSLHIADDARGIVQPFTQTLLRSVQNFRVFPQTLVHVPDHLPQLLLDRLSAMIEGVAQLRAQLANLLLHQHHRLSVGTVLGPAKNQPSEKNQRKNDEQKNQQEGGQFHNEPSPIRGALQRIRGFH